MTGWSNHDSFDGGARGISMHGYNLVKVEWRADIYECVPPQNEALRHWDWWVLLRSRHEWEYNNSGEKD
jgi:hypothetical protein